MQFFRVAKPTQLLRNIRKFSGHSEVEAKAEVDKWVKVSIGMSAFLLLFLSDLPLDFYDMIAFMCILDEI
jgi:hypothetical protein